jgi:hypothetical protein
MGIEYLHSKWMIYQYEVVFNPYYEYIIRRVKETLIVLSKD